MLNMNLEFKAPAMNVVNDVVNVLKRIEIVALFFTCFILGEFLIIKIIVTMGAKKQQKKKKFQPKSMTTSMSCLQKVCCFM